MVNAVKMASKFIKRRSKHKGPVRSKKATFDGITFASGLELNMWKAMKAAGIKAEYESEKFELLSSFKLPNEVWERQGNGRGSFLQKAGVNIRAMRYTPDFIIRKPDGAIHIIIETKGRANEAFPLRWKLFKKVIKEQYPDVIIFKPQKIAECEKTVERILQLQKA